LRRMLKAFEKSFTKLEELQEKEDLRGSVKLLLTKNDKKNGDLWQRWEDALIEQAGDEKELLPLIPPTLVQASMPIQASSTTMAKKSKKTAQIHLPLASNVSPQWQTLVRVLCKSFTRLADISKSSTDYKNQRERSEAVRTFERAFESSGWSNRDIHQRLHRARKLLKQSEQKDYYKILDVSRDADAKTIKKVYRKQAKKAHPDKGSSEAKMALLNEAYEVLSNPELPQRFDNGEDPMDPMSQQVGHLFANGQNPFAQLFQQAGPGGRGIPGGAGGFPGGFQFHFSH
ncbi:chaperone J-domain-containing protein, partial [Agrocybe pediades]